MSANLTAEQFWKFVNCAALIRSKVVAPCHKFCRVSCRYTAYRTTSSNARWPKQDQFTSFFNAHWHEISNKPYAWRFEDMRIDCQVINCSEELLAKRQRLADNNFAKLRISLGNYVITEVQDLEAMTWSSYLASLGGVLNLWSGKNGKALRSLKGYKTPF